MWPMKDGYNFIAVNFGGYHLCKTLEEAIAVADDMKPDAGNVYTNGFYSDKFNRVIGQGKWFPYNGKESF